ncbi:hypothetical protein BKI52_05150 [marine bacterium AO1-C]|nr:hypothetical protein BKI52_05150 [marine bacterium AO1-C]
MKNDVAHEMLKTNPHELICTPEFQQSILKIVRKFKQKGGFSQDSEADITQEVTTRVLEQRIHYLQKNYDPKFGNLKQYFEKMVYNITIELVNASNRRQKVHQTMDMENAPQIATYSDAKQELILDELQKVQKFLARFQRQKPKLLLLMKLYSRTIIKPEDILNFKPTATSEEIQEILATFGKNYATYDDSYLYSKINQLINEVEGKTNSSEALRKWLSNRLTDLNVWMNRHSSLKYDKEALRNLIQLFFMKNWIIV